MESTPAWSNISGYDNYHRSTYLLLVHVESVLESTPAWSNISGYELSVITEKRNSVDQAKAKTMAFY